MYPPEAVLTTMRQVDAARFFVTVRRVIDDTIQLNEVKAYNEVVHFLGTHTSSRDDTIELRWDYPQSSLRLEFAYRHLETQPGKLVVKPARASLQVAGVVYTTVRMSQAEVLSSQLRKPRDIVDKYHLLPLRHAAS